MCEVIGQVVGPVFRVPHHVLHVPPDGPMWSWRGEHKESWEKEQTLHAEALTRDWHIGLAAERYERHCRCSEHADVMNSGPRL